jgi:hypothetical protein
MSRASANLGKREFIHGTHSFCYSAYLVALEEPKQFLLIKILEAGHMKGESAEIIRKTVVSANHERRNTIAQNTTLRMAMAQTIHCFVPVTQG